MLPSSFRPVPCHFAFLPLLFNHCLLSSYTAFTHLIDVSNPFDTPTHTQTCLPDDQPLVGFNDPFDQFASSSSSICPPSTSLSLGPAFPTVPAASMFLTATEPRGRLEKLQQHKKPPVPSPSSRGPVEQQVSVDLISFDAGDQISSDLSGGQDEKRHLHEIEAIARLDYLSVSPPSVQCSSPPTPHFAPAEPQQPTTSSSPNHGLIVAGMEPMRHQKERTKERPEAKNKRTSRRKREDEVVLATDATPGDSDYPVNLYR
ncbi:unnamed protein product, partial [Protopolystoma xenopodis]